MSRAIALACLTLSAAAVAAQRPRLVVVPFVAGEGASQGATDKFNGLVLAELKSRDLSLLGGPATRSSSTPKKPHPKAVAAFDAAGKAFDELDFATAVDQYQKGLALMLADPATADFSVVVDAYVKVSAAYFRMGEEGDAKTSLLELARLAPDYALPPGYPPVFQRELEKAKKRLAKKPHGQVSIEGPSGATAYLDGRDLGMVPVVQDKVPAGTHYVKVDDGRGEPFGKAIEVKGGLVKVKAPAGAGGGVADPAIGPQLDEAMQGRIAAYAKAAGADYALVGVVFRSGDTELTCGAALYGVRRGAVTALQPVTFDTEVLTANTEAYKLAEEVVGRFSDFGTLAPLPLSLVVKPEHGPVVVRNEGHEGPRDDLDVQIATPTRKVVTLAPRPEVRTLEHSSTVVDLDQKAPEQKDKQAPAVKKGSGVPTWVWVATGVAVAAGAGVGGYFAYSAATRPVTGTVTATW